MAAITDILSTTKRQSLLDRIVGEFGKNKKVRKEEAKRGHRLLNQMTTQSQMMFSIVNSNSTLFESIAEKDEEVAEALQIIADPELKAIQQKILDREAITEKQALFLTQSMDKATRALSETDAELNVSLQTLADNSKQQLLNENIDKDDRRAMLTNMVEFLKGQGVQSTAFARIEALQEEGINFEDGAAQDFIRLQDTLDLLAEDAQGKELVTTMKDLNKDFSESVLLQEEFQEMMGEEFSDGNTFREKLLKNASAFSIGAADKGGIITAVLSMFPGGAELAPLISDKIGGALSFVGGTAATVLGTKFALGGLKGKVPSIPGPGGLRGAGGGLLGRVGGLGRGLGGKALGLGRGALRVAGPAGLVAGAGLAGFKVGSMIQEKYGEEIGSAIDSVLGFFGAGPKAVDEEAEDAFEKAKKQAKERRKSGVAKVEAVEVTPTVAEIKPKEVTPSVTGKKAQIEKSKADVAMAKVSAQSTVSTPTAASIPQSGGASVDRRLKVDDTQLAILKTLMI